MAANGASAREVFDFVERRLNNSQYRPGGKHEPQTWNWFYQIIRNEFNPAERVRRQEPTAKAQPDPQQEQYNQRAMEALELPMISTEPTSLEQMCKELRDAKRWELPNRRTA
jgi:hypothetical protein